ncbi:MAG: hypothetical protein QM755_07345 [Luteolibacter sp.]
MHAPSIHRWKACVLAKRWRHVFWISPLLGFLTALVIQGLFFHQKDMVAVLEAKPYPDRADLILLLRSDRMILGTVRDMRLDQRWRMTETAAAIRLRRNLFLEDIPGTNLVALHYLDPDPRETIAILSKVATQLPLGQTAHPEIKLEQAGYDGRSSSHVAIHSLPTPSCWIEAALKRIGLGFQIGILSIPFLVWLLEWWFPVRSCDVARRRPGLLHRWRYLYGGMTLTGVAAACVIHTRASKPPEVHATVSFQGSQSAFMQVATSDHVLIDIIRALHLAETWQCTEQWAKIKLSEGLGFHRPTESDEIAISFPDPNLSLRAEIPTLIAIFTRARIHVDDFQEYYLRRRQEAATRAASIKSLLSRQQEKISKLDAEIATIRDKPLPLELTDVEQLYWLTTYREQATAQAEQIRNMQGDSPCLAGCVDRTTFISGPFAAPTFRVTFRPLAINLAKGLGFGLLAAMILMALLECLFYLRRRRHQVIILQPEFPRYQP